MWNTKENVPVSSIRMSSWFYPEKAMVTFYCRKKNNLDIPLNNNFCLIPLSLLWARKCSHCALFFSLLARHAIFCWVHLSTQSLLATLLKLAHCKPQPFTQEKTYGGMLEDKPARWQQAVLAERYKGRRQGERKRERGVYLSVSSAHWVSSTLSYLSSNEIF